MLLKTQEAIIILLLISIGGILEFFLNTPIIENDFLGLIALSKKINPSNILTFHNGIYPPGYVLIVKFFIKTGTNLLLISKLFNWVFLLLLIYSLKHLLKNEISFTLLVIAIITSFFADRIFSNSIISPGSYIIFSFFACVGMVIQSNNSNSIATLLGLIMILISSLIRYEGIVLLASIGIFEILSRAERNKTLKTLSILSVSILIPLGLAYVSTGNLFDTYQKIGTSNINWHKINPEVEIQYLNLIDFFWFYYENLKLDFFYLIPMLLLLIQFPEKKSRILPLILFFFLIKFHPSPRGVLLIIPLSYISLIIIMREYIGQVKENLYLRVPIILMLITLVLFRFSYNFKHKIEVRKISMNHDQIEKVILQDSYFISVSKVFTNDFYFFMKSQLPETTKTNGGWLSFNSNFYNASPNIAIEDFDLFIRDLTKRGITHLMIDNVQLESNMFSDSEKEVFLKSKTSEKFKLLEVIDGRYFIYQFIH